MILGRFLRKEEKGQGGGESTEEGVTQAKMEEHRGRKDWSAMSE